MNAAQVYNLLARAQTQARRTGVRYFYATSTLRGNRQEVKVLDARPDGPYELIMANASMGALEEFARKLATAPRTLVEG